jgi:hypothetical protein
MRFLMMAEMIDPIMKKESAGKNASKKEWSFHALPRS